MASVPPTLLPPSAVRPTIPTAGFRPAVNAITPVVAMHPTATNPGRALTGNTSPMLGSLHDIAASAMPDPLHMQVMRHGFGGGGGNFVNWHFGAPANRNAHAHGLPDAQGFGFGGEIS